ncbi:GNAT family N-acetyltransferase [Endozoicomonas sp. OPT23]|uniref:GNAT family N-acetyltransferase n=1 Tax=Endozoicomonas sp. OPT23 TaxID=2072845 RepID=UPI00129A85D5|nr:GNAT family N-acetyltransferase [Endozoicomonas sp. OPT23]MRI32634.1 GNAT family N-acetyltransferase [Endozoicomonas sp. OPT23]
MKIHSRNLTNSDYEAMRNLLLSEGPNEWNYITDESIENQFNLIRSGKAVAVLLEEIKIVGFAVLILKEASPEKLEKYTNISYSAYINDVVVHKNQSGKGFGSKLLCEAINLAKIEGCNQVFIERHEENLASAGMMRKAGFEIVDTFYDPQKRSSGTRRTTIQQAST